MSECLSTQHSIVCVLMECDSPQEGCIVCRVCQGLAADSRGVPHCVVMSMAMLVFGSVQDNNRHLTSEDAVVMICLTRAQQRGMVYGSFTATGVSVECIAVSLTDPG